MTPTATDTPPATRRADLKAMDEAQLEAFAEAHGQPSYRGRQLFHWIYGKGATSFAEMTSLPKTFRQRLESVAALPSLEEVALSQGRDGTCKALFRLPSGREIETVLIPDIDETGDARRLTVCVSSQVGCAMACGFCATGQMGFHQNLTPGEITDQVRRMDAVAKERFGRSVTNVVYMGMGEPLLNYDAVMASVGILTHEKGFGMSPRRITVSTVGLARRIKDVADSGARFGLAVSLHAPSDEKRSAIMPVNRSEKTDLAALREAIQYYHEKTGREVTYEYCLFRGVNDTAEDARRLAEVTRWAPSKVNLIMYNPVAGLPFERTPEEGVDRFIQRLVERGVLVTVRRSRGQDIDAACGQLARQGSKPRR